MPSSIQGALYPTPESEDQDTGSSPNGATWPFDEGENTDAAKDATNAANDAANTADATVVPGNTAAAQSMWITEPSHGEKGATFVQATARKKNYKGSWASKDDTYQLRMTKRNIVLEKEFTWRGQRLWGALTPHSKLTMCSEWMSGFLHDTTCALIQIFSHECMHGQKYSWHSSLSQRTYQHVNEEFVCDQKSCIQVTTNRHIAVTFVWYAYMKSRWAPYF